MRNFALQGVPDPKRSLARTRCFWFQRVKRNSTGQSLGIVYKLREVIWGLGYGPLLPLEGSDVWALGLYRVSKI